MDVFPVVVIKEDVAEVVAVYAGEVAAVTRAKIEAYALGRSGAVLDDELLPDDSELHLGHVVFGMSTLDAQNRLWGVVVQRLPLVE